MYRSADVAPTNLEQVSPFIARGQALCQLHCIFPSWGVVALEQAVHRPLEVSCRSFLL